MSSRKTPAFTEKCTGWGDNLDLEESLVEASGNSHQSSSPQTILTSFGIVTARSSRLITEKLRTWLFFLGCCVLESLEFGVLLIHLLLERFQLFLEGLQLGVILAGRECLSRNRLRRLYDRRHS